MSVCKMSVYIIHYLLSFLGSKGRVYIYPLIDIIEWYREREKERMSTSNSVEYRMHETVLPRESESESERKRDSKRFLFVILSLGIA